MIASVETINDRLMFWCDYVGKSREVKKWLNKGVDPNYRDERGRTPLFLAIMCCDYSICETLLKGGADANHADNLTRMSPIQFAIKVGSSHIVRLLIDYGANINHKDNRGSTPFMDAASRCDFKSAEVLLKKGAEVDMEQIKSAGHMIFYEKFAPILEAHYLKRNHADRHPGRSSSTIGL